MAKCLICESSDNQVIRRKLRYEIERDVLKCNQCGFVFLRPLEKKLSVYYEDDKVYRQQYGPDLKNFSTGCRERFNTYYPFQNFITREIEHLLNSNTKILDVGCSTGHFLHSLKGKVKTRIGLELNQAEAEFIRNNLDFKVYSEPLDVARIEEGPFDFITSLQVLEHIEDPIKFLKQIAENLKADGYLYLEVPNINDVIISCYQVKGYENFYYREPHLYYFSPATLKKLLDQAGFSGEIKTVQRYNFLNHLHWLMTNRPQDNFVLGNNELELVTATARQVDPEIKIELNNFIKKVDREYKELLVKYDLGESLTFIGQKKDKNQ